MYLYFEDWSSFLSALDKSGIPHGEKLIKVFAMDSDPREVFGRPELEVVGVSDDRLDSEVFDYGDRGSYSGADIEAEMVRKGFEGAGLRVVRALFRFANRKDLRFCQRGMETSVEGRSLSEHPLDDIDVPSDGRWEGVHLDIFLPRSVEVFDRELGIGPESMVPMKEGARIRREGGLLDSEVVSRGVESLA